MLACCTCKWPYAASAHDPLQLADETGARCASTSDTDPTRKWQPSRSTYCVLVVRIEDLLG